MTLKLRVTWDNAGHLLLDESRADVHVLVDEVRNDPTSSSTGRREFEIPPGASEVVLRATFSAELSGKDIDTVEAVTWDATQPYDVVGDTELVPKSTGQFLPTRPEHPLVDTSSAASGAHGAVHARLATTFVDATAFWAASTAQSDKPWEGHYIEQREESTPGMQTYALGYTGGSPHVWIASVPPPIQLTQNGPVGALVYFRPPMSFSKINEKRTMYRLERYFLAPRPDSDDVFELDVMTKKSAKSRGKMVDYIYLRAGMEQALLRSGKRMMILHPVPHGPLFGHATSARLHDLARAALRFLWGSWLVSPNAEDVSLGRFGLGGYSGGGFAFWTALGNVASKVDEVYSFDTVGTAANGGKAAQWFRDRDAQGADPRIRLTSGLRISENVAVLRALDKLGVSYGDRATVNIHDHSGFEAGRNSWWDATVVNFPVMNATHGSFAPPKARGGWHQWAMFGGPEPGSGPRRTWLETFLASSGF